MEFGSSSSIKQPSASSELKECFDSNEEREVERDRDGLLSDDERLRSVTSGNGSANDEKSFIDGNGECDEAVEICAPA